jgi:hypothetical protein
MIKEHRGRKRKIELQEKINKLVVAGYSFQDIANTLGMKSRQIVRYHWRKYRGLDKEKVKDDN